MSTRGPLGGVSFAEAAQNIERNLAALREAMNNPAIATGLRKAEPVTDDLIAFLRARYDDDEQVAREAADWGAEWRAGEPGIYPSDESRHPGPLVAGVWGGLEDRYAEHVARWDPARVLAEVEAKRRILADCEAAAKESREMPHDETRAADSDTLAYVVRLLAQPFANHPGYRPEWRPDAA